jgi:hypothetical protein
MANKLPDPIFFPSTLASTSTSLKLEFLPNPPGNDMANKLPDSIFCIKMPEYLLFLERTFDFFEIIYFVFRK